LGVWGPPKLQGGGAPSPAKFFTPANSYIPAIIGRGTKFGNITYHSQMKKLGVDSTPTRVSRASDNPNFETYTIQKPAKITKFDAFILLGHGNQYVW